MPSFIAVNSSYETIRSNQWIPSTKFNSQGRIVDAEGKAVNSDYQGPRYQIIAKRERLFSSSERIGRGILGTLAVVGTLFLGLFSKSVQNLFAKSKANVRFGVLLPSSSHLSNQIVPLVPGFQRKVDSASLTVSQQKSKYVKPSLPIHLSTYGALRKVLWKRATLYVTDETGKHPETLLECLGKGGSKMAIQIGKGRALILPNMSIDPIADIAGRWERIVLEEVKMSKILTGLGLLSPLSEQVSVTLIESSEHVIPAYISETFENLSLKGCFIIDMKNTYSSTWKKGKHFLFQSDKERLNEKNWDSVFGSLLTDIAKIWLHRIPVGGDSLNIAVVKTPPDSAVCQYEVRYFGFDFSSKSGYLEIPDVENRPLTSPDRDEVIRLVDTIDTILVNIFSCEFGKRYEYRKEGSASLRDLKNRLVERYSKALVAQIKFHNNSLRSSL